MSKDTLRITEIFHSLQGETSRMGLPTVFIRLTGCPLRCLYCDTTYAFTGGNLLSIKDILAKVAAFNTRWVCVTGGEPLSQKPVHLLMKQLCDEGYSVSLETSGALPIDEVDPRVSRIVDVKTPDSGEVHRMCWANLDQLRENDEIKFVLSSRSDYEWARTIVQKKNLSGPILFSPAWQTLAAQELAQWILNDRLPVRMNIQLHKILWGEQAGV